MNSLEAIVLGIVQGLTEFLPVSSSGHLVIAKHLLQADPSGGGPVMELIAHLGTLLAVLLFFNRQVVDILRYSLWQGWINMRRDGFREAWLVNDSGKMVTGIIAATFITGVIGLAFKDFFEQAFDSVRMAGFGLLVTSIYLIMALVIRNREGSHDSPTLPISLGVGLAQGVAILPGISRSGSTIVASLLLGLKREVAFAFSFLMSVPAILGASILEFADAPSKDFPGMMPSIMLFVTSLVVGTVSLALLGFLVRRGNIGWFALYVLPLAIWAISVG